MVKREITLAIETAVVGGSLSLFDGKKLIDEWIGKREVSRSEELITQIAEILKRNQMDRSDLEILAVSRGPGSYTGARIGLATAIGLRDGLKIKCLGASVLDSLFSSFFNSLFNDFSCTFSEAFTLNKNPENHIFDITAAVSFGKSEVCFQSFAGSAGKKKAQQASEPRVITFEAFRQIVEQNVETTFSMNEKLYSALKSNFQVKSSKIVNAGENLSNCIGQLVINQNGSDNLQPVYPLSY